ncbi:futalosine hydrolase [Chitinophagaceae bacterium LB-8]|uniref:Futalosine hydrolase n=1 Tax=Paraflavisolibacter caeni TaxID=2982496 RepID=A0A9X2XSZ4_9BACT|nr:futalosine hydrolase [Paraflavisolibacter caeni]MCU7548396.1 futalosine hydrolase [Paraflavisolibacter caeni]
MQILLSAATEFEIAPSKQYFEENPLKDHKLDFLITGAGILPAAYSFAKYLSTSKPDLIIQAGIGGSLDPTIPLGETFALLSDCIADSGVEENNSFKTLFDLKLADANRQPWNHGKLVNPSFLLLAKTTLSLAEGITVNEISTNVQRINYYKEKWNAQVESLEGAALHYVAIQEKVAFLQIRTISNYIGERDKSKWMLEGAISNLNKELQRILPMIEMSNLSAIGGQIL